jgi:hypothetical protein
VPIDFRVELRLPQLLTIDVRGPDVARLDGNRPPHLEDDEEGVPDVVERWARAAREGLLGGPKAAPSECAASILAREVDAEAQQQRWFVQVDRVDWGAFRVLHNLLAARSFEAASVRTVAGDEVAPARLLDMADCALPAFEATRLPFAVKRAQIAKATRGRSVQIGFASTPPDEVVDAAIAALDLWAELVLWGGYASSRMDPRRSGGMPDGAILYDERTVAQSFGVAYFADSDTFDGVISYALALAQRGVPVASVDIV